MRRGCIRLAYSYGCVMAKLPHYVADKIIEFGRSIPNEDIFDDEDGEKGRENEPHITVKYGIHTDYVGDIHMALNDQEKAYATLGKASLFENDEFDVLKLDLTSKCLTRLNKALGDRLETTDSFPDYHPHVTIAYLKKSPDNKKYIGADFLDGVDVAFDEVEFSSPIGNKNMVPLVQPEKTASRRGDIEGDVPRGVVSSIYLGFEIEAIRPTKPIQRKKMRTRYKKKKRFHNDEMQKLRKDNKGKYQEEGGVSGEDRDQYGKH